MLQRNRVLLLVDNEVARAERLAKRLAYLDYDVRVSHNGAAGLLRVYELRPQVVIVAADMPILDGFLMLQALRAKVPTKDLPVILLTEGNSQEELVKGWQAGADLCVPLNQGEADVLATLHRALSSVGADVPAARELTATT